VYLEVRSIVASAKDFNHNAFSSFLTIDVSDVSTWRLKSLHGGTDGGVDVAIGIVET
jgi:hypothetical protein